MKVAVTGATSDFGAAILPALLDDPDIESVVGLGRRDLSLTHPKFEYVKRDVRADDLDVVFGGCDAVMHLAFVVEELRDKSVTHDINIRGSRNVIDSAYAAGVSRVVVASSINAYGPDLRPEPVTEDVYPEGDPARYYFHDKAEVEHYAEWWLRRHPGEMTISMLRPTYIIGPSFANDGIEQLTGPIGVFPHADEARYQFLHQDDMVRAFVAAAKADLIGPFNLGPDGSIGVRELAAMQGQLMFDVPQRPATVAADIAFRLGLTPFSGQWVTAGEPAVDSTKLKNTLDWKPTLTCHEAAAVMILLQGKSLVRASDAPTSHAACEAALEPATDAAGEPPIGIEHVQVPWASGSVHVELHSATTTEAGGSDVAVVLTPIGSHARYHSDFARQVAEAGVSVALVDRPGHGLSSGKRGRADTASTTAAFHAVTDHVARRFGDAPVVAELRQTTPAPSVISRLLTRVTSRTSSTPVNPRDRLLPTSTSVSDIVAGHLVDRPDELLSLFTAASSARRPTRLDFRA